MEGFDLLTQDLVCNILARLPPATLAIARCVCTGWNQIVCSQPPSRQSSTPWCFLLTGLMLYEVPEVYGTMCVMAPYAYTARTCWVYSPEDAKWFQLPAPDVPNVGFFNKYVTASQGLVVFQPRGEDHSVTDFWVGNPLTNKWRIIPFTVAEKEEDDEEEKEHRQVDHWKDQVAQLALDSSSKGYKLVVFLVKRVLQIRTEENVRWSTHVYDSYTGTWKAGVTISERPPIITASCYFEGVVYVLQWYDVAQTKLQVLAYHIERDEFLLAVPAATVFHPNAALKLDSVVQMMVKKDPDVQDVVIFEILGALTVEHETGDLENLCVFKYNASDALWIGDEKRESRIRDFYSESLLGSDIYMHCCGQAGTAYLSPHYSKQSGGLIAYDSAKSLGTCMVHPGVYAKLLVREFMERNTSTSLTSSIGSFVPRLDVEP